MEQNEKTTVRDLRRQMQQMKEEYEAKLAALTEEAPQRGAALFEDAAKFRAFLKKQEDFLNEYVEVRLFKDNEKYKDDVYVAINGKNCVIRRGVWTRIRRKFALLLDQSEIQDLRTAELMEREAGRFADESRRRSV